jgi:anti-anti-sigma factor
MGMCKMIEFREYKIAGRDVLAVDGRIDGVTSSELANKLTQIIASGERVVVMDCEGVNFVSSAGLRVLLVSQQKLSGAGGMMVMYRMNDSILKIFKMSGFDRVFKIVASEPELMPLISTQPVESEIISFTRNGIKFEYQQFDAPSGKFTNFANNNSIRNSSVTSDVVRSLSPSEIQFGVGNAALGNDFEDYKIYFGEALVLQNSLFYYPAVNRPAVDFMQYDAEADDIKYNFADGFSFSGDFFAKVSFDATTDGADFEDILNGVSELTGLKSFGIVLLAESKGIRGISIKKVPIIQNKPANKQDIFHPDNFANWFNYPLEPEDVNLIVAGVGIYADNSSAFFDKNSTAFPAELDYHLHVGIFDRDVLSYKIHFFDDELKKALQELNPLRLKHLLGKSRFSFGCLGIIKLEA